MPSGAPPPLTPLGRHSPRLQRLRELVARRDPGLTVLDGIKLIADAGAAGAAITEIYGVATSLSALAGGAWFQRLLRCGAVYGIDEAVALRLAPTRSTQGVLAVVEVAAQEIPAVGVALYLADVQDPGNVGAIVRCAAAFGAAGVACSPACAAPLYPRALRASAPAARRIPIEPAADFGALADRFNAAGGTVAATIGGGGVAVARWRPRLPVLVVLGNEGQGVPAEVLARCGDRVTVPIAASVESLNVAVTVGIVLHAVAGLVMAPILGSGSREGA